jgi:hypothetical protein
MRLINNTHLELIKILKRRRMVCQPASKCVPLMVRLKILGPSIIVIPLEMLERVLLLGLPILTPTNPIAD